MTVKNKSHSFRAPTKLQQEEFKEDTRKHERAGRDAYLLQQPRQTPEGLTPFSNRYFWLAGYDDEARINDEELA